MVALACVKILGGEALDRLDPAGVGAAAEEAALAYFEQGWRAPRRFARVAPLSFALVDPFVSSLNLDEMSAMARQLQQAVFGQGASAFVSLLIFQGDEEEVSRFAKARDRQEIREALDTIGADRRLVQIDPKGASEKTSKLLRFELSRPDELTGADLCFSGVFGVKPGRTIGHLLQRSVEAIATNASGEDRFSASHAGDTFDLFKVIQERQSHFPSGYIFVPINFAQLVRPGAAEAYGQALESLAAGGRFQDLVISLYDVPRSLSTNAFGAMKIALGPCGRLINLVISDPNFQVEEIPAKFAALVTLNLAGSPSAQRQAALQAFRSKEATYAKRGLRQSAAGLKSASEVKFCTDSGFTMLSGPAVAGPERLLRPRPLPQQAVA